MDDMFRRFLGLPPRNYGIPNNKPPQDPHSHTDEYYTNLPPADHDGWSSTFGIPNNEFDQFFKQMEDNFNNMSKIFGSIHRGIENSPYDSDSSNHRESDVHEAPRDSLLKVPDSDQSSPRPPPRSPFNYNQPSDEGDWSNEYGDSSQIRIFGGFDSFPDPFTMMDDLIKGFSHFSVTPGDLFGGYAGPSTDEDSNLGDRSSLLKKDSDLDDRGTLPSLSEGGPGYSYGPDTRVGLPSAGEPTVRRSFHSSSVVRIVKPDGSIEEKRTYKDSTGREEITVTHIDPSNPRGLDGSTPYLPGNHTYIPDLQPNQCSIC